MVLNNAMMTGKILLLFTFIVFQNCELGGSVFLKNDSIDKNIKEQINNLDNQLFKAIKTNNPDLIRGLMSDSLLKKGGQVIDILLNQVSASIKLESYKILDEYYIKNTAKNMFNSIPSGLSAENGYILNLKTPSKEKYVALLLSNELDNGILITTIYGKYDDNWKIDILQIGEYNFLGKGPFDLYDMAKQSYDKGYLMDAADFIFLSNACIEPAAAYLQYNNESEIKSFCQKVIKEMKEKYAFPLTLEQVNTKPKVFNIYPEVKHGFFPVIQYISSINLKDTAALKIENEKIKKEIGQIFQGLDKDKNHIYYQAFNEIPNGTKSVAGYNFIDNKIK